MLRRQVGKGFTLIELLVVVAIIALLISILLPSLSRARAQARQLVCMTQLRSMGNAARLYAEDNDSYLPRGIQGIHAGDEFGVFPLFILPYIGWDGTDLKLWHGPPQAGKDKRRMHEICREIPQYHCPDYPHEMNGPPKFQAQPVDSENDSTNPFDYCVSAMPIPYTQKNIDFDLGGNLEWNVNEGEYVPVSTNATDYIEASKIEKMPTSANPADLIYLTEAHVGLPWATTGAGVQYGGSIRFHTFFSTIHLPFAGEPRIANDQRHPAGINAAFFDGHAKNLSFMEIDCGYGNPIGKRLRHFTVMPDSYVEE